MLKTEGNTYGVHVVGKEVQDEGVLGGKKQSKCCFRGKVLWERQRVFGVTEGCFGWYDK